MVGGLAHRHWTVVASTPPAFNAASEGAPLLSYVSMPGDEQEAAL